MSDLNIPEAVERAQAIIERHNSCEYCSGARTLEEFCSEKRQSETVLVLASLMERLTEALGTLHDETVDYVKINNLGDPWHNQSMRGARDALAEARAALKGRE